VDLWSLGVILYILLSGSPPFDDSKNLLDQVKNGKYTFPKKIFAKVSPTAVDLVKRLLCVDPHKRITIAEVEQHPWYKGVDEIKQKSPSPTKSARGRGRRGRGAGPGGETRNGVVGAKRKLETSTSNGAKKLNTGNKSKGATTGPSRSRPDSDDGKILDERADTPPMEKCSSDENIQSLDSDEDQPLKKQTQGLISTNTLSKSHPSQEKKKETLVSKKSVNKKPVEATSDPRSRGKTKAKNNEHLEKLPKKRRIKTR